MRAVVQKVTSARVTVDGAEIARIGVGLLVFVGFARGDGRKQMEYIAEKCVNLRLFDDDGGVMNRSLADAGGELLVVSQFTLMGDARKGRRPSYSKAAPPGEARLLYEECIEVFRQKWDKVGTGQFQAMMEVGLINDGPVTILLDSEKEF